MKVLLVTDAYFPYPSGVSELNYNRALWLSKRNIDVDILTTSYNKNDSKFKAIRIGKALKIPANGSYITMTFDINLTGKIKKFLLTNKYDIIHLSGPFPPDLSFFIMKHIKHKTGVIAEFQAASDFILRSNCNEGSVLDNILSFFMKNQIASIFKLLFNNYYNRVDRFIAISNAAKTFFKIFINRNYDILPVGIDTERFTPNAVKNQKMNNKDIISLLYFGRIDKRKGLDRLLKTMPLVLQKHKNVKLFIAGKGPLMDKYKILTKKLNIENNVDFLGYINNNDVASIYSSADIYISPATGGESFGIVLLEAMASGTPVIASDIPGYREVIKNNVNGILTKTESPQILSNSIIELINNNDKRNSIIKNALLDVENNYSWEIIIDKTISIYKEISN